MDQYKKQFKVYFGDTDAAGVVHHARYIYWLEATRIDFLDDIGCPYVDFVNEGYGFVPVDLHIQYKKSLVFAQTFDVVLSLKHCRKASVIFDCAFMSANELYAISTIKLACINQQKQFPTKWPDKFLTCLTQSDYF